MDVFKFIERSVEKNPGHPMLLNSSGEVTWEDFYNSLRHIAAFFIHQGLKKGDRIGILMPNSRENFIYFFGILAAGCIEVNMSPQSPVDVICHAFKEARISALICRGIEPDMLEKIKKNLDNRNLKIITDIKLPTAADGELVSFDEVTNFNPSVYPSIDVDKSGTACIQYTSGSTGKPKGVALSQESFIHASLARNKLLKLDNHARILNVLNFSHSCSKSLTFDALVIGCAMIFETGFTPPFRFLKILKEKRPTIITGPPLLFHYLLKLKKNTDVLEMLKQHLLYMEVGLSPTTQGMFKELKEVFDWCTIINRYGLTENAGAASMCLYDKQTDPGLLGSIGNIYTDDALEIKWHDQEKTRGNVIVKGRFVMQGYYHNMKENIHHDYHKTGVLTEDIVRIDREGNIFPMGRADDVIKVGGELVSLVEVENYFDRIREIAEKAVFSIPDDVYGHKIIAAFYAEEPIEVGEVKKIIQKSLPPYMIPDDFILRGSPLPKTGSGKIAKKELREEYLQSKVQ